MAGSARRDPTWDDGAQRVAGLKAADWAAIGGSVLSAVVIVLLVGAFVSGLSMLRADPDNPFDWPSMIPGFVGAAIYLGIAYGMARRSRAAFVLGMVLNTWTLLGMIGIVVMQGPLAATVIPYALGIPAALVTGGLVLSWRRYWRPSGPAR